MHEDIVVFGRQTIEAFNKSRRYCFITRGRELQVEQRAQLTVLRHEASEVKQKMIAASNEDSANAMLSFELMIDAVIAELEMWIALKDERWDTAWDHLVNAQSAAQAAIRAHSEWKHADDYIQTLTLIERLIFPSQTFLSSGFLTERTECSICSEIYGECDHVMGKIYMGRICTRIIREIKSVTEISIVEHPADKRCRVLNFTDNGMKKDVMTWREMPANPSEKNLGRTFEDYAARTDASIKHGN